jgi:diguanylate cyclase (GGDEF)-like protein
MLTAVAGRLRGALRASETVARFGGDEFAILLEGLQDAHGAVAVAERIAEALAPASVLDSHRPV